MMKTSQALLAQMFLIGLPQKKTKAIQNIQRVYNGEN